MGRGGGGVKAELRGLNDARKRFAPLTSLHRSHMAMGVQRNYKKSHPHKQMDIIDKCARFDTCFFFFPLPHDMTANFSLQLYRVYDYISIRGLCPVLCLFLSLQMSDGLLNVH